MRIGVISDTHIPDKAQAIPREILDEFKKVDMIIHAGDLVDLSTLRQLEEVCPDVRAVYGNMDPENVRNKLPEKLIFSVGIYKIAVMHGVGPANSLVGLLSAVFKKDKVDMVVFGHSHTAFNEKVGNILFFNPGSATDKIFAPSNSYGIIEIDADIQARIIKL